MGELHLQLLMLCGAGGVFGRQERLTVLVLLE